MIATVRQARSLSRPAKVLLINQVGINVGFFMLVPYLAAHLTGGLGLATWMAGLILGIRSFSQQGLFLVGGTLADRLGYKPAIMAGCALRTVGFVLFALSGAVPVLVVAAILTGFAGALFNPAARAYLAHEAGEERRVEAFAVFNVFYQLGVLIGPVLGVLLMTADFRAGCLAAAAIFAGLTALQIRYLPARAGAEAGSSQSVLADWREAITNRRFVAFAAAMFASYALQYQVYLGLPLEIERRTGGQAGVIVVFAISAVLTLALQVRLTAWCQRRWSAGQTIARGLALMSLAFLPLALAPHALAGAGPRHALALVPVVMAAGLLALGTMLVFPFEMTMITTLGGGRLIGTYYGLYNLLSGVGIVAGNLASGAAFDLAARLGTPALPWLTLLAAGLASALAVTRLHRRGRLATGEPGGERAGGDGGGPVRTRREPEHQP